VGQVQEGGEPGGPELAEERDVVPAVGASDDGTDGNAMMLSKG
jgi:hypothetical protein